MNETHVDPSEEECTFDRDGDEAEGHDADKGSGDGLAGGTGIPGPGVPAGMAGRGGGGFAGLAGAGKLVAVSRGLFHFANLGRG